MFSALLTTSGRNAKIAVAFGAGLWGLYWIPLRGLDEAGFSGAWATLAIYLAPALLWLPLAITRWRQICDGGFGLLWTGLLAALSMVCYANGLIMTDVVRAILLFYLTPVWSTIFARLLLGEPIRRLRFVSIGLGFAGLMAILGLDQGWPVPHGIGDWYALASGVLWALAAVRLKSDKGNAAEEITFLYLAIGCVLAFISCGLPDGRTGMMPGLASLMAVLPWFLPVVLLVILPSCFLVLWGARFLEPGLVGILFMGEITIGTGSAAWLAGEPFGPREIVGVILISAAGLLEASRPLAARRKASQCVI